MIRKITLAFSVTALFAMAFPVFSAEVIMVEEPGCAWCAKWEAELGEIYPKTSEGKYAPLRKVELSDLRKTGGPQALNVFAKRPLTFTPTFLLLEDGQELTRLEGYPGEDFFWGLLKQMLLDHTDYVAPDSATLTQ